jgi:membrane-bound serine protease (ClpP class)
MVRRWLFAVLIGLGLLGALVRAGVAADGGVEIVPIFGTIDEGMAHMVERAVREAPARHVRALVLEVDSFGGLVSAGTEIRDALIGSHIPVDAYVSQRAWSASALVTLAAGKIAMAPGSSIGAAEPIPKSIKTVSALRAEFESTAARFHRSRRLAGAMVDASLDASPYKAAGAILTLTADDAVGARFVDGVEPTLSAALARFGLMGAAVDQAQYTFGEEVARFATNPDVSGLLLTIGFLGLLIEMQTLHGVAGTIGIAALALFFGTHVYAGFSNGFVIALGVLGVLGILIELHVLPGHGVAGSLGLLALVASIVLSFGFAFVFVAAQALAIAIVLTAICFALATRVYPENAFVARFAFAGVQGPEYVASSNHRALLGRTGIAASYLRPAGMATIDGQRIDVLTEGEFVTAGTLIRVTRVEGARIFVRPALPQESAAARP